MLRQHFDCEFHFEQLVSVPVGLVSRFVFKKPDNPLMRLAFRADDAIRTRLPGLGPYFRKVTIVARQRGSRRPRRPAAPGGRHATPGTPGRVELHVMLLSSKAGPQDLSERGLRWWENDQLAVGWKGHLFVPGFAAGEASVAELAKTLATRNLAEVASDLAGVFGLFVFDKAARYSPQVAVDNGGQYKVYYDRQDVGTSFLELLRTRPLAASELDKEAPDRASGARLHHGRPHRSELDRQAARQRGAGAREPTAGSGARRSAFAAGAAGRHRRPCWRTSRLSAKSLAGRALSVDATGGFDSRLLLASWPSTGCRSSWPSRAIAARPTPRSRPSWRDLLERPFHLSRA